MYGKRIRELRQERKLSQAQLAELISVTQSTIGKYEREELEPNLEVIKKICKIFNVSADYLIDTFE